MTKIDDLIAAGGVMYVIAHIKVWFAGLTNNYFGKREDVHGRTYKYVYKKFGHKKMVGEYLRGNTWLI